MVRKREAVKECDARQSMHSISGWESNFGDGFEGYIRAEYDYASDVVLAENVPPSIATYGRQNVNASIGLTYAPQQIEVMLWARNLTNDDTIIGAFPTVAQAESYSGFTNQPATYGVTVRKRF